MPVQWSDLTPEAQERIRKERPDVAPEPAGRRPSYYWPDPATYYANHREEFEKYEIRGRKYENKRQGTSPTVKVLVALVAAYAIVALMYAFWGG